jgi:hypothetical protein
MGIPIVTIVKFGKNEDLAHGILNFLNKPDSTHIISKLRPFNRLYPEML